MKIKPNIEKINKSPYYGTIMININKDGSEEIVEGDGESITPFNSEIMLAGIYKVPDLLFQEVIRGLTNKKDYYSIIKNYADLEKGDNSLKHVCLESYKLLNNDNNNYDNNFKTNAPIKASGKKYFKVKQRKK